MTKMYLLGGENLTKRDAREVNATAFSDAGGSPSVLVLPWARPSFDAKYRRRKRIISYFLILGATSVEFCEYSENRKELEDRIANVNLIYLTGGQVSTLITRIKLSGLDELLGRFGGVIVGRSAGASVLGQRCFVRNRYNGKVGVVAGLGLVNFSIKPHYEPPQSHMLKQFSKMGPIYGIPHRAAISYEEGFVSVLGNVILFENGEIRELKSKLV